MSSTVARPEEEGKNERHQVNFEDVKPYLTLKVRDKEQKIRFYQSRLKDTRHGREIAGILRPAETVERARTFATHASAEGRDAQATMAAQEIEEAERAQQRQQLSVALAD
jgi:hypothetical protein